MKEKYFDTFLSRTDDYDFSKEAEPDVVIISLGTNDASLYNGHGYTGDLTEQDLANNITSMLTAVRNQHQNATTQRRLRSDSPLQAKHYSEE